MKSFLVIVAVCGILASAAPQGKGAAKPAAAEVPIISQSTDLQPDGSYKWSFEAGNGIKAEETGTLKKATSPDATDVIIAKGSHSYTGDDGVVYSITYIADDVNGYVPQGAHLPTPPPVPEAIAKALQYIAANPPKNP